MRCSLNMDVTNGKTGRASTTTALHTGVTVSASGNLRILTSHGTQRAFDWQSSDIEMQYHKSPCWTYPKMLVATTMFSFRAFA